MGAVDKNMTIDEEAFVKASNDLAILSSDLTKLSNKITQMLSTLSKGFDTPCGAKFEKACKANLLKPISDQRLVLDHISQVLNTSKSQYESVFNAYRELNSSISGYSGQ